MNGVRKPRTILLAALLGGLGALALEPGLTVAETETGDRPEIIIPRGGGRAAFEKFGCITCHMGDGRGGQNEGGYGADLRVTKLSEKEVVETITNGRAGKGMPAFKGIIDPETIEVLAKYVKEDLRLK
jgi:mono/diheme cytochrome c family protein